MRKQYTWRRNADTEFWRNDIFGTITECIADAKNNYHVKSGKTIFIGECIAFEVVGDAELTIKRLQERAFGFTRIAEDWTFLDTKKADELQELQEQLSGVVNAWLKKYYREPTFYQVHNVKEFKVAGIS